MRYALCVMRYALCVMRYALCVMQNYYFENHYLIIASINLQIKLSF